ncbi:MAG: phasin family protein [Pseudomonadales bacterium]|nr:phasin family protein [Pseudomonadales bacterium]MBO7004605.1 phasin family protein [Pseudomonadales bacterium]
MSNPIENANKLGNQLFEIQTETLTKLTEVQQKNLERFMQSSREYSERMAQVTDPQGFAELQREALEAYWQNYQHDVQTTSNLVREAWEQVGEAYRSAFLPGGKE